MSIFTKITLLFTVSLLLMFAIGYRIDEINSQKYESLILEKYKADGRKVFGWMATYSKPKLASRIATLNLVPTAPVPPKRLILRQPHTFGLFEIFESETGEYILHVRYIDDELYLRDTALNEARKEGWILNALVLADIFLLVIMFTVILRILSPLRAIASSMREFALGAYGSRSRIVSHDEIGEVARTYNDMAQTIENLIRSREELLRDVGHELRTPIARAFFALEQIEASLGRDLLRRSLGELDLLTRELLEIERLEATGVLSREPFSAETLVMEALSKLCLEDESAIRIDIQDNLTLSGDLQYLALALKNLIDNALKYADRLPIQVEAADNRIRVLNYGQPLEKELPRLLVPFSREDRARTTDGFGLGLNIVSKILAKHGFGLAYTYEEGQHCFSIVL